MVLFMHNPNTQRERKLYTTKVGLKMLLIKYGTADFVAQAIGAKPKTVRKRMGRLGIFRFPRLKKGSGQGKQ